MTALPPRAANDDLAAWGAHRPAELAVLPRDLPLRPRAWRRGISRQDALMLGALAWLCAGAAAVGAAVWTLHWIFGG